VARRTIAEEIKLYGTLLGLNEAECERMARGGSTEARIACMRDLRRRYRSENQVPERAKRNGTEQLDFWQERVEAQRFIYFVQQGTRGPVKIGIANDPLARRSKLQTGNPQELHLRHVVPGDRALEHDLHHRFREARIRGEWFGLAYLRIILLYAEGLAAKHIECFEKGRSVGQMVVGQHLMTPAEIKAMKKDLLSMVLAWGYGVDWFTGDRWNKRVNEAMAEAYGFTPDEVEELVMTLRMLRNPPPTRQWSRRGGKKLSGRP
jgi:hypothetical protein